MTFKEQLAADVGAVFLNPQEFGEIHRVNDEEMVIVIDDYASSEHPRQASQYLDGIYTKQRRVYVAAADFGPLPKQGSVFMVDDGEYTVMDATAEGDMYMITAEVADSL
ncbi:MAG: hypothetical protein HFH54_01635 [Lachnospiraceae bacterium]|nr:hypothetical protein [Lachnospiraceae bacterium]